MKRAQIHAIVNESIARGYAGSDVRADSAESFAMARQLEYVLTKVYEYKYPDAVGRTLLPIDTSVPTGARSFTYRVTDRVGKSKIIDSYANDFPLVQVRGEEVSSRIIALGDAFFVSIQDVRSAAMAGVDIDTMMGTAARKVIEQHLDAILATGDTATGITGFASDTRVAADSLVVGGSTSGLLGAWNTNTPAQILADIEFLSRIIFKQTKGVWGAPDNGTKVQLVFGTDLFAKVTSMRLDQYNQTTIYDYVQSGKIPFLAGIKSWGRLNTADANGTAERVVGYVADPEVLSGVISQDFEMLPAVIKSAGYEVACHLRTGGVRVTFPAAMFYADHLAT